MLVISQWVCTSTFATLYNKWINEWINSGHSWNQNNYTIPANISKPHAFILINKFRFMKGWHPILLNLIHLPNEAGDRSIQFERLIMPIWKINNAHMKD